MGGFAVCCRLSLLLKHAVYFASAGEDLVLRSSGMFSDDFSGGFRSNVTIEFSGLDCSYRS